MVFLGFTRPSLASRRVAVDYGSARGFNYPAEHVGATRRSASSAAPSSSPPDPGVSRRGDVDVRGSNPVGDTHAARSGQLSLLRWVPYATDRNFTRVGTGSEDFAVAKSFLQRWGHFQLGWSEVDAGTGTMRGDAVCVCARVAGVWIRNPLRVVYNESGNLGDECAERFSFAHGCLEGHLLAGEESFVLERRADDSVWYGVNTFSKPAHPLAFLGYPAVRLLQWRFAQDSMRAVRQGVEEGRTGGGGLNVG